jgi:hypothetical protein
VNSVCSFTGDTPNALAGTINTVKTVTTPTNDFNEVLPNFRPSAQGRSATFPLPVEDFLRTPCRPEPVAALPLTDS